MPYSSIQEIFDNMPNLFVPEASVGVDAVVQYRIGGEQGGDWYITVKDETLQLSEGVHDGPTATLIVGDNDWLAICNGTLDGLTAMSQGKLKVKGNFLIAQRLQSMLPPG